MYETLLLKQSEIKQLIEMNEVIESVETAYSMHANRRVQMPAKKYLFFKKYHGDSAYYALFRKGYGSSRS